MTKNHPDTYDTPTTLTPYLHTVRAYDERLLVLSVLYDISVSLLTCYYPLLQKPRCYHA